MSSATAPIETPQDSPIDDIDRALIKATQTGLPLSPQPYQTLAKGLNIDAEEVMQRLQQMLTNGIIRRIGAVPNHYALGYKGNGMSVWNVPEEKIAELGPRIGALDYVSHCYQRPRHLPDWPYNLFAMVHGHDRNEVLDKVAAIAQLLGSDDHGHQILFSSRILKKTGLRLGV